jgi:hypothetical protein
MGAVYAAEHLHLQRKVALKVLHANLAEDTDFRERFIRESQLAASIDHPNIIPVYDANNADGVLYLAMRYVEGSDLKSVLSREGLLDPEQTLALFEQIAAGLDAAHARGLVHRDVKPANVLVETKTGHVFVTDFGIAKLVAATGMTRTGFFVGTIEYASPEQFEGQQLDRRSDVYSLGCMLFHALAGRPPYVRDSDAAVMHAHLLEPPPSLTEVRPELPRAVDGVIAAAMAKRPGDRLPTAGAVAQSLRDALGGRPAARGQLSSPTVVAGRTTVAAPKARKRVRVGRRRAGFLAVAVVALVGAGVAVALVAFAGGGAKSAAARTRAPRLRAGTPRTLRLTVKSPGQQRTVRFAARSGQRVLVSWSRNTIADFTGLTVLSPGGSEVASTGFYGAHGQLDPVDLHATGTYQLQFDPKNTSTGSATLTLRDVPPDSRGQLRPGVPLTLRVTAIGQKAVAHFAARSGQRAAIAYSRNAIPGFTGVTLLAPSGGQVGGSSDGFYVVRGQLDPVRLPDTGTYQLQLAPEGTSTGSVTLTLTLERGTG